MGRSYSCSLYIWFSNIGGYKYSSNTRKVDVLLFNLWQTIQVGCMKVLSAMFERKLFIKFTQKQAEPVTRKRSVKMMP